MCRQAKSTSIIRHLLKAFPLPLHPDNVPVALCHDVPNSVASQQLFRTFQHLQSKPVIDSKHPRQPMVISQLQQGQKQV